MSTLAKQVGNEVSVATYRVAAPGYILYVSDMTTEGPVQDGWNYFVENVEASDFAPPWSQPVGSEDAYALGAVVKHNDMEWRSTIAGNVWEPGVSGWADASADIPAWIQPTGAHDTYVLDAIVNHNNKTWKSLSDANAFEPGVSGWRQTNLSLSEYAAWIQPTGAQDAYALADRVSHNSKDWESTAADNVWEPGVYGWKDLSASSQSRYITLVQAGPNLNGVMDPAYSPDGHLIAAAGTFSANKLFIELAANARDAKDPVLTIYLPTGKEAIGFVWQDNTDRYESGSETGIRLKLFPWKDTLVRVELNWR